MKPPFAKLRASDRGQAILVIAAAMVGLAAFVGMMTDGGILFIQYGRLKRGIDAASIAAAQQFRQGFQGSDLAAAAQNFLRLNEAEADHITVYRCKADNPTADDGTEHDVRLCPQNVNDPQRKLVRVTAEKWVNFNFLRLVGWNGTTIRADSVGEAASIDLVLVIDTSSSMSYETGGEPDDPDSPLDDPRNCNFSTTDPCQPLAKVKEVAEQFVDEMIFFPYDRVAIVALTGQADVAVYDPSFPSQKAEVTRDHVTVLSLSDDKTQVTNAIRSLKVFQPPKCDTNPESGPCLYYEGGVFDGLDCPAFVNTGNPSSCNSSNIGGALFRAGGEFTRPPSRTDSFWVTILLAGGPANASDRPENEPGKTLLPHGFCPPATWSTITCRDGSVSTRHKNTNSAYDADDYARDQADFIANPVTGQGITIFTIGLGELVRNAWTGDANAGEALLQYIAEDAGDGSGYTANHGFYRFSPNANGLAEIFKSIADNIFTRIAQ